MRAGTGVRDVGLTDGAGNGVGGDWIRPTESQKCVAVIGVECGMASHPHFGAKACMGADASRGGRVNQMLPCELVHLVCVPTHATEYVWRKR